MREEDNSENLTLKSALKVYHSSYLLDKDKMRASLALKSNFEQMYL